MARDERHDDARARHLRLLGIDPNSVTQPTHEVESADRKRHLEMLETALLHGPIDPDEDVAFYVGDQRKRVLNLSSSPVNGLESMIVFSGLIDVN